jgi:hypothetical protein
MRSEFNLAAGLPSSQDLDAVAAEQQIAEKTSMLASSVLSERLPLRSPIYPPPRGRNRKKLRLRNNRAHR